MTHWLGASPTPEGSLLWSLKRDLAVLGIILVPYMDEANFGAAPLFDINDAPFDMVEEAL